MGYCQFWIHIFELNELTPKRRKLTDEQIARKVQDEFPNSQTAKELTMDSEAVAKLGRTKHSVNQYRNSYNAGTFTNGVKPRIVSYRYGKRGERVNPRTGNAIKTKT